MQTHTWQSVMHSATFLAEYKWRETPTSLIMCMMIFYSFSPWINLILWLLIFQRQVYDSRKAYQPGFKSICLSSQGMHPAFIGAQYPFSVATGPHPPMAATAVTFPGVPVPSMTQIAVHPYHTAEAALPLSTTVAGEDHKLDYSSIFT